VIETLRWHGDRLELIDQRLLPQRFEYVACATAGDVASAIRDMVVRGAPAIGCAAAYGIALEAARPSGSLDAAFAVLAASRPTAVNLFWALDRMRRIHSPTCTCGCAPRRKRFIAKIWR
jgi:methylthioribose-1-phosphate isomerase